jgi:ribosomal protein S27AE
MNKMICPNCGSEMNLHAEKLVEPRTEKEAQEADPELGALVEEFHSCPQCGMSAARRGH